MLVQSIPYPAILESEIIANDGATNPFYATANYPAAFYDSTGDRTWAAYEAWDGSQRVARVVLYDHANERFEGPYDISDEMLTDDEHGSPVICMDADGYVHCFFGAHNSALKYRVTTSPRDPSSWSHRDDISGELTYPKPVLVGSKIHLFCRSRVSSEERYLRLFTATPSSGEAVFSAVGNIVDVGSGFRVYAANFIPVSTDIHFVMTIADSSDTFRRDVFHCVYDTSDGSLENTAGGTDTAAGSLPVSKATLEASYIVINQTTNDTDIPCFCRTPDTTLHLAYLDDSADPWDIKYVNFSGGSWSSPTTIADVDSFSGAGTGAKAFIALQARSDNSVELYFNDLDANQLTRLVRSSGGVWGSETQLKSAAGNVTPVFNADPDFLVLCGQGSATELDSVAGGKEIYAYGASGFIINYPPVFTSVPTITTVDGFHGDGDVATVEFEHTGEGYSIQWKRDGSDIGGETGLTYTYDAADVGTVVTARVTISNPVGSTSASATGNTIVTPTYSTQMRTLSDASNRTLSDTTDRTMSNRTA